MANSGNIKITICMGSSCFSRGNNKSLEVIRKYLSDNNLEATVELAGTLCEGICKNGPNIKIGDTLHTEVDPSTVTDILNHHFKKSARGDT